MFNVITSRRASYRIYLMSNIVLVLVKFVKNGFVDSFVSDFFFNGSTSLTRFKSGVKLIYYKAFNK